MELLFLWIENDGITFKNQSFNFSNHVTFTFEKNDDKSGILALTENPNYINDLFGGTVSLFSSETKADFSGGIVNVTGIIGENGVGKTNLLHFIIDLLTDSLPLNEQFIIGFKNIEGKSIRIIHTLKDFKLSIAGNINGFEIEEPVEQTWRETRPLGIPRKSPKDLIIGHEVIYFNPVFDLRNYPGNFSNDAKPYIDVSTNGLIENDVIKKGDSFPDDVDKIELHKYSNMRRQFELALSNIAEIKEVNIPSSLNIIFHRNHFDPKSGKRNLTFESEDIFKHLDDLVTKEFRIVNDKIHSFRKESEDVGDKHHSYSQTIPYKKTLSDKLKVEFSYSFIHNFFKNLSDHYHENIGIKLEDIQGNGLFERAEYFFKHHKWASKRFGLVKSGILYSSTLNLIDNIDLNNCPVENDSNFFVTDITGGVTVLSNYETYITSIPSDHKDNFLSLSWRNISSGENALLDLYSRLLFAKKERLVPKEKAAGRTKTFVYLLIDEGEIGFHPKWQRDYLSNLLKFITYCFPEYLVQVIITSHSPFLVSDLPKNNLIFIEKINGKSEVHNFDVKETFASNIHTLFSNQFFMKNAVIGTFAQEFLSKELKPLLNEDLKDIDYNRLEKIINMIGEPVLKAKLTDILKSKA